MGSGLTSGLSTLNKDQIAERGARLATAIAFIAVLCLCQLRGEVRLGAAGLGTSYSAALPRLPGPFHYFTHFIVFTSARHKDSICPDLNNTTSHLSIARH